MASGVSGRTTRSPAPRSNRRSEPCADSLSLSTPPPAAAGRRQARAEDYAVVRTAKAWLKAGIRRAGRWVPRTPRPTILMYHRIGLETFDPWGLVVEADRFAAQLEWLARNRTILPLTDLARLHQERRLPPDAVSLTFDDGYASVLDAVPLLRKHAMRATVFLPVEIIEQGRSFWWDELAHMIIRWPTETLQLDGMRLSVPVAQDRDKLWPPNTPPCTPRQKLFQSLWSRLHAMRPRAL